MRIVFQNVKFQSKTQEKNWFYGKMTGTLTWHYSESKLTFYIKKIIMSPQNALVKIHNIYIVLLE